MNTMLKPMGRHMIKVGKNVLIFLKILNILWQADTTSIYIQDSYFFVIGICQGMITIIFKEFILKNQKFNR